MPVALLDVNFLVALFDQDHIHHEPAHSWFAAHRADGWATCPLTENGVIRILSNLAYSDALESADQIRDRLDALCKTGDHVFWGDSISLRDGRFDLSAVTHRQLTDLYLLALAIENGGRLATFDGRIRHLRYAQVHHYSLSLIQA
jgi:toxin-antitoxin system PIN domain toxin